MAQKLDSLDAKFRKHHFQLVELMMMRKFSVKKQEVLDEHDDDVDTLTTCIKQLMVACSPSVDSSRRRSSSRRLTRLEKNVTSILRAIDSFADSPDVCLLQQYEEQL